MSSAAQKTSEDKRKPSDVKSEKQTAFILLSTAADTTWRMFVPTLGGTLLGLWIDGQNKTEPIYGIVGLFIGVIITAMLIRQQYRQTNGKN